MTPDPVFSRGHAVRPPRRRPGARAGAPLAAPGGLLATVAGLGAQTPGTQDTSFNAGALGTTVYAVDYAPDPGNLVSPAKITVGGDRFLGGYILPSGVGRTDFILPDFGNAARIIYTIVPERFTAPGISLPNLLLGGNFGRSEGQVASRTASQNIVRIMPDGSLDTSFVSGVGVGANNFVTSILPLADGRIVVGGQFTSFDREPRRRIVRLLNNGAIDESFATGSNIDNDVLVLAESIAPATGQADGSTLVGGIFNHVAGQPYGKLARLDPNGNLDMSFHPSIDLRVLSILVQSNGKIVIGGDFTNVNGTPVAHIARLNYDGSLDKTFTASVTGVPNNDVNPTAVYVMKALSDGRIYLGGEFAQINGTTRRYLGLISADGVLDTSFDPGTTVYNSVQTITIQSDDNNLLIGETLGPKIGKSVQPSLIRLFGVTPGSNLSGVATQQQVQPAATKKTSNTSAKRAPSRNATGAARLYIW